MIEQLQTAKIIVKIGDQESDMPIEELTACLQNAEDHVQNANKTMAGLTDEINNLKEQLVKPISYLSNSPYWDPEYENRKELQTATLKTERAIHERLQDIYFLKKVTYPENMLSGEITRKFMKRITVLDSATFVHALMGKFFEKSDLINKSATGSKDTKSNTVKDAIDLESTKYIHGIKNLFFSIFFTNYL